MRKLFLSLLVLLYLVHGQAIAQPGTLYSVKVQPDDKIVVAGTSYDTAIAVGRYVGEDLDPDMSFGNNGITITSLNSAHTVANAVELQPDGKIVVAGAYEQGTVGDFILVRYKPDGSPDSSFGLNGIVLTDIGSGSFDVATALAIQTDGKLVAAGWSDSSLALCRYNTDGSPDSSFDSDGKLTIAIAGATSMVLQANGKIVVCGGIVITRLNPDGSLDAGFGTGAIASLSHYFYGMTIQNDGKILLSGANDGFVLQRLDTAGNIDNSFGDTGTVTTTGFITGAYNPGQGARWVCLQGDGRILAGGWTRYGVLWPHLEFAIARYEANGAPDSSFGTNGKLTFGFGERATSYSSAISTSNECIVVGVNEYEYEWAMVNFWLGPLGVHTVSPISGNISVSPNPAGDFVHLQSPHIENGTWHLTICDLTGRILYSETVVVMNNNFDKNISLIGLPAAMYLVKLDNGISRMLVKLTKNR